MSRYYLLFLFLPSLFSCSHPMADIENDKVHYSIIPKVSQLEMMKGLFVLDEAVYILAEEGLEKEAAYLSSMLSSHNNLDIVEEKNARPMRLELDNEILGEEAYLLDVSAEEVYIRANTAKGVFYGIQSLIQLIQEREVEGQKYIGLGACRIEDSPI